MKQKCTAKKGLKMLTRLFAYGIVVFTTIPYAFSQKYDYIWPFGDSQGVFDTLWGGANLDFNYSPIKAYYVDRKVSLFNNNYYASICNAEGELKLYSDGCSIYNNDDEIIIGGDTVSKNDQKSFLTGCFAPDGGFYRISNTTFINQPDSPNKYILIYKGNFYSPNDTLLHHFYANTLELAYINPDTLAKGLVEKRKVLLQDTMIFTDVTAVKHVNGEDWWLLSGKKISNTFFKFLIKSDTVLGPFVQQIGDVQVIGNEIHATFSPDGKHYGIVNKKSGLFLYDFDRNTGELSNFRRASFSSGADPDTVRAYGIAFSPSSKYVYVSALTHMYQLETNATDLESSKFLVGVYDGFQTGIIQKHYFWELQAGPDCRIYGVAPQTGRYLHVIYSPDEKGLACDFRQHDLQLPVYRTSSMPNFPYYRLGTNEPICDSLIAVSIKRHPRNTINEGKRVLVYPDPASDVVHVSMMEYQPFQFYGISLFNVQGQKLYANTFRNGEASIDVSNVSDGMYFIKIDLNGLCQFVEKVLVSHR